MTNQIPPIWKQALVVLLLLFPIVMLQLKYLLPPLLTLFDFSLATFICNAISVGLIFWPLMPFAFFALDWWLLPQQNALGNTLLGTGLIALLYLVEITLFWNFLPKSI